MKKVNEDIAFTEVEDPKEKKARKKAEAAAKRAAKKAAKEGGSVATKPKEAPSEGDKESIFDAGSISGDASGLTDEQKRVAVARAVTGTLSSKPAETDLKFDSFSVMVGGNMLVNDCHLEVSE
jgi:hypothetical protein